MAVRIIISGKVQGVFYRQSTKEKAIQLGIKGYVKNLPDETVEVVANGDRVNELIDWCRKGPEDAVVTDVKVVEIESENYSDFTITR